MFETKKFFTVLAMILAAFSILPANAVLADEGGTNPPCPPNELCNPLGETDTVMELIDKIIAALRDYIAPPIVALMVLYGAFQILFAGGEPEKFATGRKTILYAAIGYAIILIASGISLIIKSVLDI